MTPPDGALAGALVAVRFPDDVFAEIAVTLLVSALAGLVAVRLHQPVVVAYVAVGVLVARASSASSSRAASWSSSRSSASRCSSSS